MEKRNSGQLFIHSNSLKKNSLSFQPDQAEKNLRLFPTQRGQENTYQA